jgi:hypothetical protein
MFNDDNYINVSENSDSSLKRKTFYESRYVSDEMKQCLDELRKIYPNAKNYGEILCSVFRDFSMFCNLFNDMKDYDYVKLRQLLKAYENKRIMVLGIKFPKKVDWVALKIGGKIWR